MRTSRRSPQSRMHRDESGQILLLFLFLVFLALAVLMLNISTGMVIEDKLHVQTAADMSALSGGAWVARTLNHISMNNVAMTETLAWILVLRGARHTVLKTEPALDGLHDGCLAASLNPYAAAFCATVVFPAWHYKTWFLKPMVTMPMYENLISETSPLSLWRVLQALKYMNKAIVFTYPAIGEGDAWLTARRNKASFALLLPYPGTALPVAETTFCHLCDPTMNGSRAEHHRGYTPLLEYDLNEGPLKKRMNQVRHLFWPLMVVGGPYTFKYFTNASFREVCEGCTEEPQEAYYNITFDYEKATQAPRVHSSCWIRTKADFGPTEERDPGEDILLLDTPLDCLGRTEENDDFERAPPAELECPGYLSGSSVYGNGWVSKRFLHGLGTSLLSNMGFRDLGDGLWRRVVRTVHSGGEVITYTHHIEQYRFIFAKTGRADGGEEENPLRETQRSSLPGPTVFTTNDIRELAKRLSFLAVAYKPKRTLPFETVLSNPNRLAFVGYAQVLVHNPTAADLFTQDWHVKLVPADKLEQAVAWLEEAASSLTGDQQIGGDMLANLRDLLLSGLSAVNHH
ncbi:MAG: hypothetical protein WB626_04665 [Bacteroidota bacterium]